jgi:hypothetical protein
MCTGIDVHLGVLIGMNTFPSSKGNIDPHYPTERQKCNKKKLPLLKNIMKRNNVTAYFLLKSTHSLLRPNLAQEDRT